MDKQKIKYVYDINDPKNSPIEHAIIICVYDQKNPESNNFFLQTPLFIFIISSSDTSSIYV